MLGGSAAKVLKGEGAIAVNRTLATVDPSLNEAYWTLAGYREAPSVSSLVGELVDSTQN